jgi:glutamate dehydrogenase (NAD(P)+)
MAGKTLVIQGLGNVGSYSGTISQEEGDAVIIGVSEIEGTIVSEKGINMEKLLKYRKDKGTILGFPGTKTLADRHDWISIDCDILVPAALENQITTENAKKVKARVIAEAANGPVTSEAADILNKKEWPSFPICTSMQAA